MILASVVLAVWAVCATVVAVVIWTRRDRHAGVPPAAAGHPRLPELDDVAERRTRIRVVPNRDPDDWAPEGWIG